jgi:hypothetical protein
MMPGVPPGPANPGRRQNEYQYAYPPQAQNPYYTHPQHWVQNPYYAHTQNYPQYPQQYAQPQLPRQYRPIPQLPPQQQQQHHAPLIVSSHPPPPPFYPASMNRRNIQTPPVEQTQTPPQLAPVPQVSAPLPRESPALSTLSTAISTPPPSSSASRPSTAADLSTPIPPPEEEPRAPFQPPVSIMWELTLSQYLTHSSCHGIQFPTNHFLPELPGNAVQRRLGNHKMQDWSCYPQGDKKR